MNKKQRKIWIGVIILVLIGFLIFNQQKTLSTTPEEFRNSYKGEVNKIGNFQVYSQDRPNRLFSLFTIVTKKNIYKVGEIIDFAGYQGIYENCNNLRADVKLQQHWVSLWNTLDGATYNLGPVGYITARYITELGPVTNAGNYRLELRWFCDNVELGLDGSFSGNSNPEYRDFEVINEAVQPPPEPLCKIRSCSAGERLINSDRIDCFCQAQWTSGDGRCDLGETAINSVDCGDVKCQDGFIKVDGLCANPDNICEEDGGNVDCSDEDGNGGLNTRNILTIGSIIAGILLIGYGIWRQKK